MYWSKKNGDITSLQVFKNSHTKYWFDCDECKHEFSSNCNKIVSLDQWCSFCGNKELCGEEGCQDCYNKSFASHEKSTYWSKKNGDIIPRQVFKNSNEKYWFECEKCSHSFCSMLNGITRGQWCSFCGSKQLCGEQGCQDCYNKSFASHEKSTYWSKKNGDIIPRQVFKNSNKKYWFDCDKCNNDFSSILSNIVGLDSWCPICINKTEQKLFERLQMSFPFIQSQFRTDWCKKDRCLPFDFVLHDKKIIIELDGRQHFVQVSNWLDPESQFEIDQYKQQCANEYGYSIIRLLQEDVWYDRYDWYSELISAIRELEHNGSIRNIYLCKNQEYEKFII